MGLALRDFEGDWRLDRQITDHLGGASGVFCGAARLVLGEDGRADWAEHGTLRFGAGAAHPAERRYQWAQDGAQIAVFFADGRFFHRFSPDIPGAMSGEILPENPAEVPAAPPLEHTRSPNPCATHLCGPDTYRVRYDFAAWPLWRAHWQVEGPRKHYEMTTTHTRA